jgi:hypothetical protein
MSITFELKVRGEAKAINFANTNAAALMTLAGLNPEPFGEVRGEALNACVNKLLRAINSAALRSQVTTEGSESPRRIEGPRSDEYVARRAGELLSLLASAQRHGCAVVWG